MGDFQGHPFRGNQWSDGRTMNVTREEGSAVTTRGRAAGALTRRGKALNEMTGRNIMGQHTQEEWKKIHAEKEALSKKATEAFKAAADARERLDKRKEADLEPLKAEMDRTRGDSDAALKAVILGLNQRSLPAPLYGAGYTKDFVASMPEELQRKFGEYQDLQSERIRANEAYGAAMYRWDSEHRDEAGQLDQRVYETRNARRDALAETAKAEGALKAYEHQADKAAQTTGVTAREPRETPATAMVAYKSSVTSIPGVMTQTTYSPTYEATIKTASAFKESMEREYPGLEVEGVPRKADPHMLTMIHDEFRTLRDEFPEVSVMSVKLNAGGYRGVSYYTDQKITLGVKGVVSFNDAHRAFASGPERESPDEAPTHNDGARSYAYVVRHEFGHQVHNQHPELFQSFMDAVNREVTSRQRGSVTTYARKNSKELFSEAFALVKYGDRGTKAHPVVRIMDRELKSYFSRKRGGHS